MAETLGHDARTRCKRVIGEYPRWAPDETEAPQVSGYLGEGHSNVSVLLSGRHARWVLRLPRPGLPHGLDRHRELIIHERAAAAGLAPPVLYHDVAAGILLTAFVDASPEQGDPAPRSRGDDPATVAALLRAIHDLDPELPAPPGGDAPVLDTPTCLQESRATLSSDPLQDLDSMARRALAVCAERLAGTRAESRLCHNDLIRANRIDDGQRLLAIDWEYACHGDPFFDLANAAWEFDPASQGSLLRHYLGREEERGEAQRFADQLCMQAAIACCWHAERGQADLAAKARTRLCDQLRAQG